ncbi:FecR domain-containing protein [Chitinophaga sp. OAE865]|uniref:FecR family protein n=1 Tax=Chitinophaga sp. OAE865 TaxID=2817898 RepID=UPI001AE9A64E
MNKERLQYLLTRYRERSITAQETQELLDATAFPPDEELLAAVATLMQEDAMAITPPVPEKDLQPLIANILAVDNTRIAENKNQPSIIYRLFGRRRTAAAAILIAAALTAAVFYVLPRLSSIKPTPVAGNISAGKQGPVLTLADGTRVTLDSVSNGVVAVQQGARVVLKNGALAYHQENTSAGETAYNTMATPNGRKFSIALPDGSIAWLNAASTIRYPTNFTGTERAVEITGEVFLEIAARANQPFKVYIKNTGEITVLGTSFNINAYNPARVKATLLTGKISLSAGKYAHKAEQVILQPGEQAQIEENGEITNKKQVNTKQVTAWRYDLFNFEDADLEEVLGQISRWYDVNIITSGPIPDIRFGGQVNNATPLPDLLDILKAYGVNCKLEGRNLVVLPIPAEK